MKHLRTRNCLVSILGTLTIVLLFSPQPGPTVQQADGLTQAWEQARAAGAYTFIAQVEQSLIPRPMPSMVGQTDQRVDMQISGEVILPDYARMDIRLEGIGMDASPVSLVQDGAETYLLKDGEKVPVENPAALSSPTADYLGYLAAVKNVSILDEPAQEVYTRYTFEIDGPRFAAYVQEQLNASLEEPLPAGMTLTASPVLQTMTGRGELWVDGKGLPRRQVLDLDFPGLDQSYQARSHMVIDFTFDNAHVLVNSIISPQKIAASLDTPEVIAHLFAILLVVAVAAVMLAYRRRRWVYGLVAVIMSVIMVASTPLQAVASALIQKSWNERNSIGLNSTIEEALGAASSQVKPEQQPAAISLETFQALSAASKTSQSSLPASTPSLYCGTGSSSDDTDGDSLNDAAENCLGTDPYSIDSDQDLITDTLEIDGFVFGGQNWTADPLKADSNGDGLTDGAEWPAPVGQAPDMEGADDWDPDGDGVPNLWDADNDGDGVRDKYDLSPFSHTAYTSKYSLSTQGDGFDGYQYIEIQIQPQNEAQLRYSASSLDWPLDSKGQITDDEIGDVDMRLVPMLRIYTRQAPSASLAQDYGVGISTDEDGVPILLAPLSPVGDGGQIAAFSTKIAYGPGGLDSISWDAIDVIWMVLLQGDQPELVQFYPGGNFRVSGLQITKSRDFQSVVLGTPGSPDNDREIFQLLFGLSGTFLNYQEPDLSEIQTRFGSANTDVIKTWGVPVAHVAANYASFNHMDEGLLGLVRQAESFLASPGKDFTAYPIESHPALIMAIQQEAGAYSLDDAGQFQAGAALSVNLAEVVTAVHRGLKLKSYDYENGGWQGMFLEDTLGLIQERYSDLSGTLAGLQADYPELTPENLHAVLALFYTSWYLSQSRLIVMDGQAIVPVSRSDLEVHGLLESSQAATLPAYLFEIGQLGQSGGGLRIGESMAAIWSFRHALGTFLDEIGFMELAPIAFGITSYKPSETWSSSFADTVLEGWDYISNTRTAIKAVKSLALLGEVASSISEATKATKIVKISRIVGTIFDGLDVLAYIASYAMSTYQYVQAWQETENLPSGLREDMQTSLSVYYICSIAVYTILFVLSVGPWGYIGAIISIIDLLCEWVGLGSLIEGVIDGLSWLFGKTIIRTYPEDINMDNPVSDLENPDAGMSTGNTYRIKSKAYGTLGQTRDASYYDLIESTIQGRLKAGSAWWADVAAITKTGTVYCSNWYTAPDWKRRRLCENTVEGDYRFGTPRPNVEIFFNPGFTATTIYEKCAWFSCDKKIQQWNESSEDITLVLDVLPASLDGFWTWPFYHEYHGHIFNLDRDGDGLGNTIDPSPDAWDADSDKLSDRFEIGMGSSHESHDADGDGLPDGYEYRFGTSITSQDSDGDGLLDCQEVNYNGTCDTTGTGNGGWLVNLPGRTQPVRVYPSAFEADADGDGLSDLDEKMYGASPYAYNSAPRLTLEVDPVTVSPEGAVGAYLKAGNTVSFTLNIESIGLFPVTSTLAFCLPGWLTDLQGGVMQGDRQPALQTAGSSVCPEGHGVAWSFSGGNTLQIWESVSATLTARVQNDLPGSYAGEVVARLPYQIGSVSKEITSRAAVVADNEVPWVSFDAPIDGAVIGGGAGWYVLGGTAGDSSSWISRVDLELPAGTGTIAADGEELWAFSWQLPADGVYNLQARAYDYAGYASPSDSVQVTVDNTAPTVSLDWNDGEVVSGVVGEAITVTLTGSASDNLSGLTRVQVSTDGKPWQEVWTGDGSAASTIWSMEWRLSSETSAQGEHTVSVKAWDLAGNQSGTQTRTLLVDVVPPTSELTNRSYLMDTPYVTAGEEVKLHGAANDAGRRPSTVHAVTLEGMLDTIHDSTIWLGLSSVTDDDGGVEVAWLGDLNGDRLADLVVGLPGADPEDTGTPPGTVTIVYGQAGGWPVPDGVSLISESRSSFIGAPGAAIGEMVAAAGDVNGDGFDDLLVGDRFRNQAYLIFGRSGSLGSGILLDGTHGSNWSVIGLEGIGNLLGIGAAGDVNGDGFGDLLLATDFVGGQVYLLLGQASGWWESIPLSDQAAAVITIGFWDLQPVGLGDLDNDGYDEFAVTSDNIAYIFPGGTSYHALGKEPLDTAGAYQFANAMHPASVTALGDVNNDGFSDFIMTSSDSPSLVYGDTNLGDDLWTTSSLNFSPPPSGFLAAAGDVDSDGHADLLAGNAEGDAYLILGSNVNRVAATFTGVAAAASAPYPAGADINSDGSSDLLLVPSEPESDQALADLDFGQTPYVNPAWLPETAVGLGQEESAVQASIEGIDSILAMTYIVDDDNCPGTGSGTEVDPFCTVAEAVTAAVNGDQISVQPGVYSSFTIDGKDNLNISGVHPDAVFIDGSGAEFAVKISSANGVRLSNMTIRDAQNGIWLENAGVGGAETPANKILAAGLVIHSFSGHALYMSRSSTASLDRCTLVSPESGSSHIEVYGEAEPALSAWTPVSTGIITATHTGGGLFSGAQSIYLLPGEGNPEFYHYYPTSGEWQEISLPVTMTEALGAVPGSNGSLHVVGGPRWSPLGSGLSFDQSTEIRAPILAVDGSGNLYAGGEFVTAGGIPANHVARWDGSQWYTLESGIDGWINALAADSKGNLYVGGGFATAGGVPVNNVARWNGSTWSAMGSGFENDVLDIIVGSFDHVYASTYNYPSREGKIAYWQPNMWYSIPQSAYGSIETLAANVPYNGWIYFGGNFTSVGSQPANNVGVYTTVTFMPLGSGTDGSVSDLVVDQSGKLYAGGYFSSPGSNIAVWDGTNWSGVGGGVTSEGMVHSLAVDKSGNLYAGGSFTSAGGTAVDFVARWDGNTWYPLGSGMDYAVRSLVIDDSGSVYAGGWFHNAGGVPAEHVARWATENSLYNPLTGTWQALPPFPMDSVSLAGDGASRIYTLVDGSPSTLHYYNFSSTTWKYLGDLPFTAGTGSALVDTGQYLYALSGGSQQFWQYDPISGIWQELGQLPAEVNAAGAGASLAWDGGDLIYAIAGGNGRQFLRYSISAGTWQMLGDGDPLLTPNDLDTPEPVNEGGGLAFAGGELYFVPGGDVPGMWRMPRPEKLTVNEVAFVTPETSTNPAWLTFNSAASASLPIDFGAGGGNNTWVGGSETFWYPALTLAGSSEFTHEEAGFLNPGEAVYRLTGTSLLTSGYHSYRQEAVAATSGEEFTSIQDAINSGANRVLVRPGVYEQSFYLLSGVQVTGAGAWQTILVPPVSDTTPELIRLEGASGAGISGLSLAGDGSVNGLQVEDGARGITINRTIIRDTANGINLDGLDNELEVVNNTITANINGLVDSGCASVNVRNTIFAENSSAGINYLPCTSGKLHSYNLYWANSVDIYDGTSHPAVGVGELFMDPLFVDAQTYDYRTLEFSPVIDAGDPGDPAPPGTGQRVDIGYLEEGRAAYYVDDDYCDVCINDGLTWGVDAYSNIQDAMNAARADMLAIHFPVQPPKVTVGVGPGTYIVTQPYLSIQVPSYVRLVGSGAGQTILNAEGEPYGVSFHNVVQASVEGFTIIGAVTAGVVLSGSSNQIAVSRNLIMDNGIGVLVWEMSTGEVAFNTIVSNEVGVQALEADAWAVVENNILSGNETGMRNLYGSQIFHDYNLLYNGWDFGGDLTRSLDEIIGLDPNFADGTYQLNPESPAVDSASPFIDAPPGGGNRADMGYRELLASPLAVFLGKEGLQSTGGNSGIGNVMVGISLADPSQPVTATLPTAWAPAVLDSPGTTVSYWEMLYTPAGGGYYRIYSKASDLADNEEVIPEDWYEGSFVVDNTAPIVTLLAPTGGTSLTSPLELRAEVLDYPGGMFAVEGVYFLIDGTWQIDAEWAVEPWDPGSQEPRIFRAWVNVVPGSYSVQAVAFDKADNTTESNPVTFEVTGVTSDSTEPSGIILSPVPGSVYTGTVPFSGTAFDADSGIASVEVSVDGGYSWLPADVDGEGWSLNWETPEGQDSVSYPAWVRFRDRAGYSFTYYDGWFKVDNTPPVFSDQIDFSAPPGSHFDSLDSLTVDWHAVPVDGNGSAVVLLAADHMTDTVPTQEAAGTSAVVNLEEAGTLYVHLAAQDPAGNQRIEHFGPWYIGTFDETALEFTQRRQSIVIDGFLDLDDNEWKHTTEFLDDNEAGEEERQSLYATWAGDALYLGWQGAWWTLDGTLWAYLQTGGIGTDQPVETINRMSALPLQADFAVMVTGSDPEDGELWQYVSGSWQLVGPLDFAHGPSGGTEIRVPLENDQLKLIALAVNDDGWAWSVFPASQANVTSQMFAPAIDVQPVYTWNTISGTDTPNLNQPQDTSVDMTVESPQPLHTPWGPGDSLTYVVDLTNLEDRQVTGLQLALSATTGLTYQSMEGAICTSCPVGGSAWVLNVPSLGSGASNQVTITAQLASNLGVLTSVTTDVALQFEASVLQDEAVTHRVDGTPPDVEVSLPSGYVVGSGLRTITGVASDVGGSGVTVVSLRLQGTTEWQDASGTQFWSAQLNFPDASADQVLPFSLDVKAVDAQGNQKQISVTVYIDGAAPDLTLPVPQVLTGQYALFEGSAQDTQPSDSRVVMVDVQLDDENNKWQSSSTLLQPDMDGLQNWTYTWLLPVEDNVSHQVRARAYDAAGNEVLTDWIQTSVDNVAPVINVTAASTEYDPDDGSQSLLAGTVVDGAGVSSLTIIVYTPNGQVYREPVDREGDSWKYTPVADMNQKGTYMLRVEAIDTNGNIAIAGPYYVAGAGQSFLFLPLVTRELISETTVVPVDRSARR